MGASLDRFSQPLSREYRKYMVDDVTYEVEQVIVCEGCGQVIYDSEDMVASEIWEDEYTHDHEDCLYEYYKKVDAYEKNKEKDPLTANKRVG